MKKIYLLSIQLFLLLFVFSTSCKKKKDEPYVYIPEEDPLSGVLYIGKKYQGGIIAYIDNTREHGFITSYGDMSKQVPWDNGESIFINTESAIGTGKKNTEKIVEMLGDGIYAAKICADYVSEGYSDWYLPSKEELDLLWSNRDEIGGLFGCYWSSTDNKNNPQFAYAVVIPLGVKEYNFAKAQPYSVRPIRYF